ncbi:MAG: amino acid ABC transporter ATP-binding protein [Ruminococcaceae bacterium]|nr:amino acid ABC transporter ATP-binding protein [Oscillospiraceae bacterium]
MALLEVKNLKKSFGETEVLKDISFSLEKGKVLSIIGSSGSGKTTLLRCLNFLEKADSGEIFINDELIFSPSLNNLSSAQKRKNQMMFGLVFQSFNLFPQYNVLDNVTLAVKLQAKELENFKADKKQIYAKIEEDACELLTKVGLYDKRFNYPCELSGGQQQRVAIARALALNPQILCFDEPTSALDPELTGEVLSVIRNLASHNITMIIVTHEMNFAREVSNEIIFMDNGVIAEQGEPNELFANPKTERLQAFLSAMSD